MTDLLWRVAGVGASPAGGDVRRSWPVWLVEHLRRQNSVLLRALAGAIAALQLHACDGHIRDGTVTAGPYPEAIGGLCVVDAPSREEALEWAAEIAVACRCAQEVREFMPDPTVGN